MRYKLFLILFLNTINFTFSQNNKIIGDWRYVGISVEKLSVDGYLNSYIGSYDRIKDKSVTNFIIFHFKKNMTLIEEIGATRARISKYFVNNNLLLLSQEEGNERKFDIILLTKNDLIIFEKDTKDYHYLTKHSKVQKRLRKFDRRKKKGKLEKL